MIVLEGAAMLRMINQGQLVFNRTEDRFLTTDTFISVMATPGHQTFAWIRRLSQTSASSTEQNITADHSTSQQITAHHSTSGVIINNNVGIPKFVDEGTSSTNIGSRQYSLQDDSDN
jgi:hypothetical protein